MDFTTTVITSTVVAAAVTSLFMLLNGWRERKARMECLLMEKAVQLVLYRNDTILHVAEQSQQQALLHDPAFMIPVMYRELKRCMQHGTFLKAMWEKDPVLWESDKKSSKGN